MKRNTLLIITIVVVAANIALNMALLFGGMRIGGKLGTSSGTALVDVLPTVSISLTQNTVNFGQLNAGSTTDTLGGTPSPFVLENTGNVLVDVDVQATALWTTVTATDTSFAFQSSDNEPGSVDTVGGGTTVSSWQSIPISPDPPAAFVTRLNFQSIADSVNGDIQVTVPSEEPATGGTPLSSTVTFTASQSP